MPGGRSVCQMNAPRDQSRIEKDGFTLLFGVFAFVT